MADTTTAFSPELFIKIAQMMHSPVKAERMVALDKLNKMLADAKMCWEDVLKNGVKKTVDHNPMPTVNPFEDMFRHWEQKSYTKQEKHQTKTNSTNFYDIKIGTQIPRNISGTVRIREERMTRKNTPMLVVEVHNHDQSINYAGMVVFKQHIIDRIKAFPGEVFTFSVVQSDRGHMPTINSMWM